jgi:5'(3')-deoxyribonucleotidase
MNIYLDMDDVVADWRLAAEDFLGIKFPNGDQWARVPDDKWLLLKGHSRFYRHLPVKTGAHELVAWVTKYSRRTDSGLYFLSALPHGNDVPWAVQDKVWWAHDHFPHIPVFLGPYSYDKHVHCRNIGDILIDDRPSNCEEWIAAGGQAHVYKEWPECKLWLEQTLGELKSD